MIRSAAARSTTATRKQIRRVAKHSAAQFLEVVADVKSYENFLPFCQRSRVLDDRVQGSPHGFLAALTVGYGALSDTYTSHALWRRQCQNPI